MEEEQETLRLYPSLEVSPEFKEVIENCKTVEDILEILKKGTHLWKVRSFNKWYRRKYHLDDKTMKLCYDPSHKSPCYTIKTEIDVGDIVEVRKGWKTDTFNKIGSKVEKNMNKMPGKSPVVEENACFSIIHGNKKESLDLVAPNETVCDQWVRGLKHLVTVIKGLEQERNYERWLKHQFDEADKNKNGNLDFEECLKLLKQLNCKMPKSVVQKAFDKANKNKRESDGERILDADEFVEFFFNLMKRPEIEELFFKYAQNSKDMNSTELCQFLQKEQNLRTISTEECSSLIKAFEQSMLKEDGKMTLIGFTHMLLSEQFEVFNPGHRVIYQDMSHPLSHYYIASSHNTYLTGNQISGESSVEGYIDALKRGCRCVELDCWDGTDEEPIIYHGYTLTSKILFRDVLTDAVKPYAFHSSQYPLILSLENHCSEEQQETLAKHLNNILGDMLYLKPVDYDMKQLPSPETLKGKIIVKAKKSKTLSDEAEENEDTDTDEETEVCYADADEPDTDQTKKKRKVVSAILSELVNICQAVRFQGFDITKVEGKCFQMSSFSEAKAQKLIEESATDFVEYNKIQLSRIYPAGKRTDSSNYKPYPYWNIGCQIVALNYQSVWKPAFFNEAKFRQNGNCGYVLKPSFLWEDTEYNPVAPLDNRYQKILKLKIISGQHIPKPDQSTNGEVVDPYVKVKIIGHPEDKMQKWKTDPVKNNGFNPKWNKEMVIPVKMPELAIVHFTVKDHSTTGINARLGTYAVPFTSLQEGYHHVYLMDYSRTYLSPASIFIHISISG